MAKFSSNDHVNPKAQVDCWGCDGHPTAEMATDILLPERGDLNSDIFCVTIHVAEALAFS